MSIFEAMMLICFGAAWPISILKSWKSRSNNGKSIFFLYIVLVGYGSGITHKILYSRDLVLILYAINCLMVLIDILLYYSNARLERKTGLGAAG